MRLRKFLRAVSCVVLVTFSALCAHPTIAALKQESRVKAQQKAAEPGPDERYSKILTDIEELTKKAKRNRSQGKPSKTEARAIRNFDTDLTALEGDVEAIFAKIDKHLNDKNLAEVIKERHRDAVATYRAKRDQFKALTRSLAFADDKDSDAERDLALTALTAFFDKHPQTRKRTPLNPSNLPWRTSNATVRPPITDSAQFKNSRFGFEKGRVVDLMPAGASLQDVLKLQPTQSDLTATEDAQITPAIMAKAQELGNNPIDIYNFVRNNIRFVPTYGSIQGSQDTLDKLAGNSFDTASLLIALLRAANIPARYAYATIEVPADQLMNWVGGVTKIDAALNLLGQGGIPSIAVTAGGFVKSVRMEHAYVEAWIDFSPSRAARQRQGDTWVPMDASFKQYLYAPGLDLTAAAPIDLDALAVAARDGAVVNETDGWVQNLNVNNLNSMVSAHTQQVSAYVGARFPSPTVADVFGRKTTRILTETRAAGTLLYHIVAQGPRYATLPDWLRHQFRYKMYSDAMSRSIDSPTFSFQRSLPKIVGKRLTLSFKPETEADAEFFASFLPKPHLDGSPILPSEFVSQIPAYAYVVAELKLDDEVVAGGGRFQVGAELAGEGGFTTNDLSGWDVTSDDTLVAGQVTVVGLSLQGIGKAQLQTQAARLLALKDEINAGQTTGQTSYELLRETLTSLLWTYFAALQAHSDVAQQLHSVVDSPGLSYGLVHGVAQPNKLYGVITTSVRFPGLLVDIGHLRNQRAARSGESRQWIAYNRARGLFASAMEHALPEAALMDPTVCRAPGSSDPSKENCNEAVSAMKALAMAHRDGQRIYYIRSPNRGLVDELYLSAETKDEILNAVAAGKEAVVHERPVSAAGGWLGTGYIVIDPTTGAGAYLIEGKANGAIFATWSSLAFAGLMLGTLATTAPLAAFVGLAFLALNIFGLISKINRATNKEELLNAHFLSMAAVFLQTVGTAAKIGEVAVDAIAPLYFGAAMVISVNLVEFPPAWLNALLKGND